MSTSFGWKKKRKPELQAANVFEDEPEDEEDSKNVEELVELLAAAKRMKGPMLEDSHAKSSRLREEGAILAENERYWEAIARWDEAIQLTPDMAALHEMKSQALMLVSELFQAVQSAERAVQLEPNWSVAYQTLGRAQLGIGEIKMALVNFQKSLHIDPSNEEVRNEDISWTTELLNKEQTLADSSTETNRTKQLTFTSKHKK